MLTCSRCNGSIRQGFPLDADTVVCSGCVGGGVALTLDREKRARQIEGEINLFSKGKTKFGHKTPRRQKAEAGLVHDFN